MKPAGKRRRSKETEEPEQEETAALEDDSEPEDDSWRRDNTWILLCCDPKLRSQSREVVLEYTSEYLGIDPPKKVRIQPSGSWVWRPDANNILVLGPLASCRGADDKVGRPFFACQASRKAMANRPSGQPTS